MRRTSTDARRLSRVASKSWPGRWMAFSAPTPVVTPKRSKDFERILRCRNQEHYDLVWWYVVPSAVERVVKLVFDNRTDHFIEVRSCRPAYFTTRH